MVLFSVADLYSFFTDPDQAWKLNMDPVLDPDPDPSQYYDEQKFICPYQ